EQLSARRGQILIEIRTAAQSQRIADADGSGGGAKLGDEYAAIRFVELARLRDILRSDDERSASCVVEDPSEEGRTVEPRNAEPGDRAIATNQRGSGTVANQSEILDWEIAVDRGQRPERR